jgi:replicative DNA helicase
VECEQEERAKEAVGVMQDLLFKDQRPYGAKRQEIMRTFAEINTVKEASRLVAINEPMEADTTFGPFVGFAPWDEIVNGLGVGRIHVLAGRPGRGKTTMAVQWCRMATCPSLLVPLEMGLKDTVMLADRQGTLRDDFYVIMDPVTTWAQLRFDVAWAVQAKKARLVVFDHLGYLKLPAAKTQNRVSEVGDILRAIKALMRDLQAAAVIVCQLNRAVEGRKSERPELSDLRESGEIEQEADTVTFLWAKKGQEYEPEAKYCLTVSKNRHGSTGGREIVFNRPERRFE